LFSKQTVNGSKLGLCADGLRVGGGVRLSYNQRRRRAAPFFRRRRRDFVVGGGGVGGVRALKQS